MSAARLAAKLAEELGYNYQVIITPQGWIDIRMDCKITLSDELDFARIIPEDNQYRLVHLIHNEISRGEATFSGSMIAYLPGVVRAMISAS
ncbi:hypothetical protein [Mycobacteroides abscessus]|uniref:hypothetical protein n=1 Tax=Mycobacteroides abscessus TaxID=36809 RepID=UPI0009263720|nr:hypothetical protein [Mycobacteroides abscessus]DAZ90384.1 TPA_asm: hypothetical protein PROPHIFSQJ01-1_98 [Mycobacterium phage prophiFSQJ01-1]SII42076.1 Uncharacterised protein [Mycobacteroides abscessus subsp. abscessus]SIK12957.1 Uncharacterised protein [Mycobacteroides abscessus subsp. abscessus]SIN26147.1 Uncharacterised protein [Mycobacteroides abscessus subsp. abscessus]SLI50814.1 Uncharacterised protein [Mycobacteroides abscessus subsp. abscessus]